MSFINPFNRIKDLTEQNYLRVSVANFLELPDKPQEFYNAVQELIHIREGLRVANEGGLIEQIGGRSLYFNELRWLKLEAPLNEGIAVSQIASYDDINNESISSSFYQQVQWVKQNHFINNPIYQQIQVQLGVEKTARLQKLDLQAAQIEDDFRATLQESQQGLGVAIEQQKQALNQELAQRFTAQAKQVIDKGNEAVTAIEQAKGLQTWNDYYEANVEIYEEKLSGRAWKEVSALGRMTNLRHQFTGRMNNLRHHTEAPREKAAWWWAWLKYLIARGCLFIVYLIKGALAFLYQFTDYAVRKVFSIKGRRLIWFSLLGVVLIGQAIIFFFVITNTHPHHVLEIRASLLLNKDFTIAKVSAFLGFILVPSLGYASANKNYRIYSNLLEQYRHRATVAKTLQGILISITENEDNQDIRRSLAAVAAAAMFELKAVGHLSKNDGSGMPFNEVLQTLLGSRN